MASSPRCRAPGQGHRAGGRAEAAEAEAEAAVAARGGARRARRAAAAAVYVSPPRRRRAADHGGRRAAGRADAGGRRAGGRRAAGGRIAAGGAPPPIARPPPALFQKLTEPVALGDTFRSHVLEPDEVAAAGEAGVPSLEDRRRAAGALPAGRHARRRRRVERRRARGPGDLAADGGAPREGTPVSGPRGGGTRGDKALADAEARRLDREQNAEKYAAEDAARRVSEAEASIGDADVVRLRKV